MPATSDNGLEKTTGESQPEVKPVKKKDGIVKRISKKISSHTTEGFLFEAAIEALLPKIRPLVLKAKPKLIKYLMGHNQKTGEWSTDAAGNYESRTVVIKLTKAIDPNDENEKRDIMVMVYKNSLMRIQTPEGREKEALEEVHGVEQWVEEHIFGAKGTEMFEKEVEVPADEKQEGGEEV